MNITLKRLALGIASAGLLTIYGCGGGGGGTATVTPAAQITGTAATGGALANAPVTITNSAGTPCVEPSISTTALGSYTCTLKTGQTAPFFIVVTDPTGQQAPLVSIATTTPAAGTPLTVNATPLTTAIIAQLNNGNALGVVASGTFNAADLATVTASVLAQLKPVLDSINAPAGYNPFTTSITAATSANTGNTADQVLDIVKIGTDSAGQPAFSTVTDPTPVTMATKTTAGTAVAIPLAGASDLSNAAQIAVQTFTNCFALPTAQRVLTKVTTTLAANGGPEATNVASLCQNIVANGSNASPAFLQNGYSAGQFFYGMLTSDTMTGAQFSVPEIMAFYPAAPNSTHPSEQTDRAILNIRFLDNAGNPGNVIVQAANIAGSSSATRPTNWWLVGNQHPADVGVKLQIRRVEQRNPTNTSTFSTFQTGVSFNINAQGPGSVVGGQTMSMARITGPGLPTNGLVYIAPSTAAVGQSSMDLWNKTGSLTVGLRCGNPNGTTYNCPNLWLARSADITGAGASTLASNPSDTSIAPAFKVWTQLNDGSNATLFVKGAKYQFELFYGTSTTAAYTFKKTLLSDLVQATQAVNLPWNTLGTNSVAALDPTNSLASQQTNTLLMDWVQNPAAQQIGDIEAVINSSSGSYSPGLAVNKGATSAILTNATVPAFTSSTNRTLLFGYKMLDGSKKTAVYTYN